MKIKLIVERESQWLSEQLLDAETQAELAVGRDDSCGIILPDPMISRQHARITANAEGEFVLEDLGSANGLVVGNKRVRRAKLLPGTQVFLPPFALRIEAVEIPELVVAPKSLDDLLDVGANTDNGEATEIDPIKTSRQAVTEIEAAGLSGSITAAPSAILTNLTVASTAAPTAVPTQLSVNQTRMLRIVAIEANDQHEPSMHGPRFAVSFMQEINKRRPILRLAGYATLAILALGMLRPLTHWGRGAFDSNESGLGSRAPRLSAEQLALQERQRIVQQQLSEARALLKQEKYEEAAIKVDLVLEKLDAKSLEATTLREELTRIASSRAADKARRQYAVQQSRDEIQQLVRRASQAMDAGQLTDSKAFYQQALVLDPENTVVRASFNRVVGLLNDEQKRRNEFQSMRSRLDDYFAKGMAAYNTNNYGEAAQNLRQVVAYPQSQHFARAKMALADIEERMTVEAGNKLERAREHYIAGRLLEARRLIDEILLASPKQPQALNLREQVVKEARDKAQQLYREGYTFENLVQDARAAKERYQAVIELLPEASEPYHQKAKARLNVLN